MHQRICFGPYDLFSLKHDLVVTLQPPTNEPAQPLTKETFKIATQFIKEFGEKERGRILPERFEDTKAKYVAIWARFISTHQEYYRKRKYLHVAYNPDNDTFSVVIPDRGRPPKPNSADKKIDFRLDTATTNQLDNYCRISNIQRSQAIREAIELFLADKGRNK
ncbi:hypothetical protein [Dendrosporobacter sp. 1207_IL3150]|uniref:hypothetical protein n=1 Tax=Dendrosporobacter sp. 1207_IL3150 TaxID=3084054 RepID=UPI002FDA2A4D